MMPFKDKTAIVIGGGSGIGKATAVAAAAAGISLVVADLREEAANEVAAEINRNGGVAVPLQADITRIEDAEKIVRKTLQEYGQLNYLCYSAGLQTYGTAETTDEAIWDSTLNVNLKGMFLAAKFAIPEMRRQGGGAVVNISSVQGIRCQQNVVAYATSKGGAIALTRAMALDHARENIRFNCICPGSIDTPLLRFGAAEHGPVREVLEEWGNNHPIGRIGSPDEIARTVLFLWSEGAAFLLGQSIVVDGGLTSKIL